jgi:septal ring factor EnvC (AmiA/AmiB activator)
MSFRWRISNRRPAAVAVALAALLGGLAALPVASSADPGLGQLNSELGQQQARSQQLASSVNGLSQLISSLSGQIALVQSREAAVQSELSQDRARLQATKLALEQERRLLALLRARLARGRMLLARQLVSNYESGSPDLVAVLLEANGFKDLLEKISFLRDAEQQQQTIIAFTRRAKAKADGAARRLAALELSDQQITHDAAVRAQALAGMNALLQTKQAALERAQSVQRAALVASQARASQLQGQISQIEAQQAAEQAAQQQAAQQQAAAGGGGTVAGTTGGGAGGWVIPSSIVLCESGGQNLPPNGAGASGYYQILPSTWKEFGGTGSAAYGASRAEQNLVASRIWAGGSGAQNWVCSGMVGIH